MSQDALPVRRWPAWLNFNLVGLVLLLGAFALSVQQVLLTRSALNNPDKIQIRIAHWQLEVGYRDALDTLIQDYQKLHPEVEILQQGITERIFPQWLNTRLISGDAPDLVEFGTQVKMMNNDRYLAKYFMPLTEEITRPNPYNAGTVLEGKPWRDTFQNNLRGSFRPTLQDYYYIPTTLMTARLFYNKDKYRQITGSDRVPATFEELIAFCQQARALPAGPDGRGLIPIAGSKYSLPYIQDFYSAVFTAPLAELVDTHFDGYVSPLDTYDGLRRGVFRMDDPALRAYHEVVRELCGQFSSDFNSLDRQQATFMFLQGRALMMYSGAWDASTLISQAKFEVGVMPLPLPQAQGRWGGLVAGPPSEAGISGNVPYAVYQYSKHRAVALDFLRFITAKRQNEKMNQAVTWYPIVRAAEVDPRVAAFAPQTEGFALQLDFTVGSQLDAYYAGLVDNYLTGLMTLDAMTAQLQHQYRDSGLAEKYWDNCYRGARRDLRVKEQTLAAFAQRQLQAEGTPSEAHEQQRMRRLVLQNAQLNGSGSYAWRFRELHHYDLPTYVELQAQLKAGE